MPTDSFWLAKNEYRVTVPSGNVLLWEMWLLAKQGKDPLDILLVTNETSSSCLESCNPYYYLVFSLH